MEIVKKNNASLLPIDSEHNAIFQSLPHQFNADLALSGIRRILLTASGGPFRNFSASQIRNITVEMALKHPTWKMGKKITIDSATLMNKGLEVIEAHYLFGIPYENIDVLIHPQSIAHSMVEYRDGSVIAQLSVPDMRLPISYALNYPARGEAAVKTLDLRKVKRLDFAEVDFHKFRAFFLALKAAKTGGTMPACMNAANEVAVKHFLAGNIKFGSIPYYIEKAMKAHRVIQAPRLEDVLKTDALARMYTEELING